MFPEILRWAATLCGALLIQSALCLGGVRPPAVPQPTSLREPVRLPDPVPLPEALPMPPVVVERDPAAALRDRLIAGKVHLTYTPEHGYLESVLAELEIPISSQVLVFSKTSLQQLKISPQTPRAIYFNDDSYVGWIPHGDVIEIMSTDPQEGEIFYTLKQDPKFPAELVHDRGNCMACHENSRTLGVPGVLARSVIVNREGRPEFSSASFTSDHGSPFAERWGGWYVTGKHGAMRHLGNVTLEEGVAADALDMEAGANVLDLSARFPVADYLSPHSDIVALLVLNHQAQLHNLMTLATYECRAALHLDAAVGESSGESGDPLSDTARYRIAKVGDRLLRYLLFCGEYPLPDPVQGTSKFASEFHQRGPFDSRGRSLRDFDLTTRLFRYPCSFLIYSPSFDHLPAPVKAHVVGRLHAILLGQDQDPAFAHLTADTREAILQILNETKPGLWKASETP
jgi:hypothetical protein